MEVKARCGQDFRMGKEDSLVDAVVLDGEQWFWSLLWCTVQMKY